MRNSRNTRFIQNSLYKLRNDYGINNILWCKYEEGTTNYINGTIEPTIHVSEIKRAVSLPATNMRKYAYALAFLSAAGPQFSYGGYFDVSDKILIVRLKDIKTDFEYDEDDILFIDHKKYIVKKLQVYDEQRCLVAHIRKTDSGDVSEVHLIKTYSSVSVIQEVNYV